MSDVCVSTNEKQDAQALVKEELEKERYELLRRLDDWLDKPMLLLALVWLALLVGEMIWGQIPAFEMLVTIIWIFFVVDFALEFFLAPDNIEGGQEVYQNCRVGTLPVAGGNKPVRHRFMVRCDILH